MQRRVKVLDTNYDRTRDLVRWLVKDITGDGKEQFDEITLAWPGDDLGQALGITSKIPPDAMDKFCDDIIGKEINLVMDAAIKEVDSKIFEKKDSANMQDLYKAHDQLDRFPYHEVISQLEEGDHED